MCVRVSSICILYTILCIYACISYMASFLSGGPTSLLQVLLDHQELLPSLVVTAQQRRLPPGDLSIKLSRPS